MGLKNDLRITVSILKARPEMECQFRFDANQAFNMPEATPFVNSTLKMILQTDPALSSNHSLLEIDRTLLN